MSDKEKYGATDESPIIDPPNDTKEGEGEDAMALHEVYEKLGEGHKCTSVVLIPFCFQTSTHQH